MAFIRFPFDDDADHTDGQPDDQREPRDGDEPQTDASRDEAAHEAIDSSAARTDNVGPVGETDSVDEQLDALFGLDQSQPTSGAPSNPVALPVDAADFAAADAAAEGVDAALPPGIEFVPSDTSATPGGPNELRVVVDFRGLPPQLTQGAAGVQDGPSDASPSPDTAGLEGLEKARSGAGQAVDPQPAAASAASDAPAGASAASSDTSALPLGGDETLLQELRARIEAVLSELLAAARKQQTVASQGALPLALPVMLRSADALVAKAIFNASRSIAETAGEIVDGKINELKFFLYSEDRRVDRD